MKESIEFERNGKQYVYEVETVKNELYAELFKLEPYKEYNGKEYISKVQKILMFKTVNRF